ATLNTPSTVVPFRHTQSEMAECYQAADLTIVPSEYETFGRVAAESLFCGTPVLAFATGGLPDIVTEGICGRLVSTGDTDAMAAAIADLKRSPQQLHEMREGCVADVRDRFSTEHIANEYIRVYERVIAERSGRALPVPGGLAHDASRAAAVAGVPVAAGPAGRSGSRIPTPLSCIIPAWNCEPWLARAVESVIAAEYSPLDIVIVDDGSTDGTLAVARKLSEQYPNVVRVLQHPCGVNRGVSASRNLGLKESTGEWISFLDADDYVYPHRFDSAVDILSSQPDVDGVHQLAEMVFPTEEVSERWWKNSPYFGFSTPVDPYDLLTHLLIGKCWATSAIVFRRRLLDRTGLFHEQLKVAEDCHLWFRMAAVGRIVSGDLTRPVSAYWRRLDSAYQPSPTQRLPMIRSMASFLNWLRGAGVDAAVRKKARQAVSQYVMNGLVNARFDKQRRLAWSIAWQGLCSVPSLSVDPAFCGQVARLAAGR
ncbi:MAG: glycosyltransferase, partial [Planctomycetaceae bacterium]|nr:glycosyltransferase [Planctomycetaceae bacterium]